MKSAKQSVRRIALRDEGVAFDIRPNTPTGRGRNLTPVTDDTGLEFSERMSDSDALMWTIERDPLLRSTITAVAILDGAPDPARLRAKTERGTRLVPRLRQRVVANPFSLAPPRWEFDPYYDLDYHLRTMRCPGNGTLADVLALAQPIAMQGFDRARPLWEMVVVDGLAGGGSALIVKMHHAITDGVGAVRMATVLFDLERDPVETGAEPEAPEVRVLSQPERMVDAFEHERRRATGVLRRLPETLLAGVQAATADPAGTAAHLASLADSVTRMLAPAPQPETEFLRGRSLSFQFGTLSVPLEETKAAAKAAGGRLNDAFVAAALGGLCRYRDHVGSDADSLLMTMPINVRTDATAAAAGNQFAPSRFRVPLGIDDPRERMQEVNRLVAEARGEPALALVEPLAGILRRLPGFATTAFFGSMLKTVDFVTSNVPGVPFPLYVAGTKITSQFAFGPLSGAAANLTLLSYLDQLHIGVNTDASAVPEPDVFLACLEEGFDEIRKSL